MGNFHKCLAILCTVTLLGTSSTIFGNFLVVTPEQISASSEGLFVNINGIAIAVESLNTANDGFVVAIPLPRPYAGMCPNCGHDTYTPGRTCTTCGFPIWDGKKLATK